MKNFLPLLLVFTMGCLLVPVQAPAATTTDVLRALRESQRVGNSLGMVADKDRQAAILADIKQASAVVDQQVAALEADPAITADLKARVQEFKAIWADYQKTRDEEVIPAALAGDQVKAQRLRTVVQLGRLRQMILLMRVR